MQESGMLRRKDINVDGRIRKIYKTTAKGRRTLEHLKGFVSELSEEVT
jgi:DNA-binding PadR family transcriptional regulator